MSISKLAKRRILKLCDYMESLPPESAKHFSMKTFVSHNGDHDHELGNVLKLKDLHTCGTSACALGYAVTSPYFRRAGLFFSADLLHIEGSHEVFDTDSIETGDFKGWDQLFESWNKDKTPKSWARRVRRLVAKWEKSPTVGTD